MVSLAHFHFGFMTTGYCWTENNHLGCRVRVRIAGQNICSALRIFSANTGIGIGTSWWARNIAQKAERQIFDWNSRTRASPWPRHAQDSACVQLEPRRSGAARIPQESLRELSRSASISYFMLSARSLVSYRQRREPRGVLLAVLDYPPPATASPGSPSTTPTPARSRR